MTTTNSQFGLLKISGVDAKKFLQGQLTCDLEKITPSESSLGAHCNPQGRVIFLFRISIYHNDYFLIMPSTMTPIAESALRKYAPFFKVSLMNESENLNRLAVELLINDLEKLKQLNINAGIPAIYPETSGKFLPHELNLPSLNAVSFDKGCFTGQEIIARMHYRGKPKVHLYQAQVQSKELPLLGAEIYNANKQACGYIVDYDSEYNKVQVLIICNDEDARSGHLYLDPELTMHAHISGN